MSAETWQAMINPAAGGGRCGKRADGVLTALRERGFTIDAKRTERPGDATRWAKEARERGASHFLAVGGDGTSYEVVNGLFAARAPIADDPAPPVLGMLPLGTGNSFLRDFGVQGESAAIDALARSRGMPCDVLRVEHDGGVLHAINIVSLGFSADVGALTNRRYKPLGALGYVVAVFQTAIDLTAPVFPMRLDGGALDARPAHLVSFCNSQCTAGSMRMAPHAAVADGFLDVVRIGERSRASFVAAFPSIFAGTHVEKEGVEEVRARAVDLELDAAVPVMIDGEIESLRVRRIEVIPRALRVAA